MAEEHQVGHAPHSAGSGLPCIGLRQHWTRVLLQLVVLLVGLYTALHVFFAATPSGLGTFGRVHKPRQRSDIQVTPLAMTSRWTISPTLQGRSQIETAAHIVVTGSALNALGKVLNQHQSAGVPVSLAPSGVITTTHASLGSRLNGGSENRGMFDYSFENGTLAARAFPMSKNRITAVLLIPLNMQSAKPHCRYQGAVALWIRFLTGMGDLHDAKSVPAIVECTFTSDVAVARNGNDVMEITGLGMDVSVIQRVPVVDYRWDFPKPFDWTVCTPSLHGSPFYPWIDQWLNYYTDKLKVDHVFMYTVLEGQTWQDLNNSGVRRGLERVSLVNVVSQMAYHPYYHGQTFTIHDCLMLNRHLGTKWVMFQDMDEVLTIPSTFPTPLDYFLQSSHNGVTALTFGNWFVYANKCLPETSVQESEKGWPWIARMVPYSSPFCSYLCADWQGRRKYVLQPDKHEQLFIHNPLGGNVRHVNVSSGYVRHYRQAALDGSTLCQEIVSSE